MRTLGVVGRKRIGCSNTGAARRMRGRLRSDSPIPPPTPWAGQPKPKALSPEP